MLKGGSITLYRPHSNYWLLSTYVYLYAEQVTSFWGTTLCTISPSYTTSVALLFLSHGRARSKLWWKTLPRLLDVLRGLTILDLCSERTWTATSSHDTAKGVAWKTRSEPPPSPASLAVGSTPRAKRTCLLALLNITNATSPCLHFCCTNNRIIIHFYVYEWFRVRKLASFAGKGGCTNY